MASVVPLIIDGKNISVPSEELAFITNPDHPFKSQTLALGATPELCYRAIESSATAFKKWRYVPLVERRCLFNKAAALLRDRRAEITAIIMEEIACSEKWANINLSDGAALLEEVAATVTSGILSGVAPSVRDASTHAVVFKEPLGVVVGIAPWNSPLILGIRAIAAAVAAGNTVIFKGSELSPRAHYFVANLFRDAGFPPGVVNFILHRPSDAPACFEALISHPAVRKCNFTGSTAVGRLIAARAAQLLKPVLLELGGKNYAVVLEDADIDKAAAAILEGAFLNTGQICMSTDIVLVSRGVEKQLRTRLREQLGGFAGKEATRVINARSEARIRGIVVEAQEKGALVRMEGCEPLPATLIEDITEDMAFWTRESFGPVLGLRVFDDPAEAIRLVNGSVYGLSAAIFTQDQLKALQMARELEVGAIHVNAPTVHDEACLPHGGYKDSGWGRFGGHWAFEEFLQTKTVILSR